MKSTKQLFTALKNLVPAVFGDAPFQGLKHDNLSVENHAVIGNCVRVRLPMPSNKKLHTKPKMRVLQSALADRLLQKGFMVSRDDTLPWAVKVWVSNL